MLVVMVVGAEERGGPAEVVGDGRPSRLGDKLESVEVDVRGTDEAEETPGMLSVFGRVNVGTS